MGCANGEVAPFVGHNAFLRWSALQDAAFIDPDDGLKKIWSESNVSEDFDMALRLQVRIRRLVHFNNGTDVYTLSSSRGTISDGQRIRTEASRRVSRWRSTTSWTDGKSMLTVRSYFASSWNASNIFLGCNELIFNPLKDWWKMGPITKQLRTFLWSGAPVHYKFSMWV